MLLHEAEAEADAKGRVFDVSRGRTGTVIAVLKPDQCQVQFDGESAPETIYLCGLIPVQDETPGVK